MADYTLEPGGPGGDTTALHDDTGGEINAIAEKTTPVGADLVLLEDSAASFAKKKVQVTNLPGGTDADAIHDNVSGEISAITEKTTPVSADLILIEDSAATNAKKKVQIGNLPSSGGASTLLWEWNGTDVSQFGTGDGTPDSTYQGPAAGTIAAAQITNPDDDAYRGNVILYTHSGGDGDTTCWWSINDLPTLPERYLIRAVLGPRDNGAGRWGEDTGPGITLAWQDSTHHVRIARASTAANLLLLMGNNTDGSDNYRYSSTLTGNKNTDGGTLVEVLCVLGDPTTGVDPNMQFRVDADSSSRLQVFATTHTWSSVGTNPAVWDSSWQTGGTIRQPGLFFREEGIGGKGYIADFKIFSA